MNTSMDTGGLAQMTYNMSINSGSLGVPGSGFASRGKGSHIKRLSVPHHSKLELKDEPSNSTPRTSRSHLLAGLRTAPKHSTGPSTAPLHQQNGLGGAEGHDYDQHSNSFTGHFPQTATGTTFSNHGKGDYSGHNGHNSSDQQMYSLPEHVLAPPALDHILDDSGEPMDDSLYAELVSTNLFLAAQQQRLQQQLASVTAAAHQLQALNIGNLNAQQQFLSPDLQNMGVYQQQAQHGMQPIVLPIPGKPGVFSVYNPMTGQQNIVVDNSQQLDDTPLPAYGTARTHSPMDAPPTFRAEVSPPPPESQDSPVHSLSSTSSSARMPSPPRQAPPLQINPPNTTKRDHRKNLSLAVKLGNDSGRAGTPKSAVFPPTPRTGTFGPGQGRAGEHPTRQPRGPPPLEELTAKPTAKCEGSKNFVTRQRRRAVHSLVRARMERRGEPREQGHNSSGGNVTPSSETDFTLSPSDGDEPGTANTSLSGKPSLGSLRAAANGAIGSERKEKDLAFRSYGSGDSLYSPASTGADSGVRPNQLPQRRKMPMLVLSNAEKRKSPVM